MGAFDENSLRIGTGNFRMRKRGKYHQNRELNPGKADRPRHTIYTVNSFTSFFGVATFCSLR